MRRPPTGRGSRRGRRPPVRALLLLVVALAGLAGGSPDGWAGEVTDMLGRRVRIPDHAARIVSLAPSITETVFVLGDGDRLVGVTDFCDYPPEAARKPRVGGISTPSFEAILALRPDLIIATSESNYAEHVERLVSLGLPVYVVQPVDFETVLESIDRIGRVLGRDAAARARVAAMRRDADAIARAVAGSPRPRVLYVVWPNPLIAPGRGTLITELIHRAGGESVTAPSRCRTRACRWRPWSSGGRTGSSWGATGRGRSRSSSVAGSGSARSAPCARDACSASTATSSTGRGPA